MFNLNTFLKPKLIKSPFRFCSRRAHQRGQQSNANTRKCLQGLCCLLAILQQLGLRKPSANFWSYRVRYKNPSYAYYNRRANTQRPHGIGNQNESHPQQVIIIAGPHKTASSSIQHSLIGWFEDKNDTLGLQKRWSFDSPIKTFQKQGCSRALQYPYQIYYWMVRAMLRSKNIECSSNESTGEIIYEPKQILGPTESYTRKCTLRTTARKPAPQLKCAFL